MDAISDWINMKRNYLRSWRGGCLALQEQHGLDQWNFMGLMEQQHMKHMAASAQLSFVHNAGWVSEQIWILRKATWSAREVVLSPFFVGVKDPAG